MEGEGCIPMKGGDVEGPVECVRFGGRGEGGGLTCTDGRKQCKQVNKL